MLLRRVSATLIRVIRRSSQYSAASSRHTVSEFSGSLSGKLKCSHQYGSGNNNAWNMHHLDSRLWIILSGQAAVLGFSGSPLLAEDVRIESNSENEMEETSVTGLQKIEDGSVISNIHTSKWRVFTDNGRDYFLQGKLDQAEKFFLSAIQEAKEGFGERDPHVASACNNLAELYRVKKAFNKAEPLYLEAISILEESFGPEDVRTGAALHNLGQFYLVQRKLEEARGCYERALKMKRRVLGHGHPDYADTMFHLGTVLYLQGKEKDAEALILDSVKILEEGGQEESITCIRRLRYLSQIYTRSNRLSEAENIQRKILHKMELSKGWNSLETVNVAEELALTLQSNGELREARELFERCLATRKNFLPEDHIQIGANMLHIARLIMLNCSQLRKTDISGAVAELDKVKDLLGKAARLANDVLYKVKKLNGNKQTGDSRRDARAAFVILLQSFDALGLLETTRNEMEESKKEQSHEAEEALFQCISAYKEFGTETLLGNSPEAKSDYLSCLKHLLALLANKSPEDMHASEHIGSSEEVKDEIKRIEAELSSLKRGKSRFRG